MLNDLVTDAIFFIVSEYRSVALTTMDASGMIFPPLLDSFSQSWYKEIEVNTVFVSGLILAAPAAVFGFRWFSSHKFEYLHGVKPSEQLDQNFWLSIGLMCPALVLMAVGLL